MSTTEQTREALRHLIAEAIDSGDQQRAGIDAALAAHERTVRAEALRMATAALRSQERVEWQRDAEGIPCAQVVAQSLIVQARALDALADRIEAQG